MVGLRPLAQLDFSSNASFLLERLMLSAEAPRCSSVEDSIMAACGGSLATRRFFKEKWPTRAGTRTRDSVVVWPHTNH